MQMPEKELLVKECQAGVSASGRNTSDGKCYI